MEGSGKNIPCLEALLASPARDRDLAKSVLRRSRKSLLDVIPTSNRIVS